MAPRKLAHAKQTGGPASARSALANAYQRLFKGSDAEMVLADLANIAAYYRRPNYGEWMQRTGSPSGFELHSALSNARAEVVQHILDQLMLPHDVLVALERAARAEHER